MVSSSYKCNIRKTNPEVLNMPHFVHQKGIYPCSKHEKCKLASKMVVFKNYEGSLFFKNIYFLLLYLETSDLPIYVI